MTRIPKSKTEEIDDSITEYIRSKIGIEPNAWGSRRRWHFLRMMASYLYEVKHTSFPKFFVWATAHCQCMKKRTLREDYLDTLQCLDFVDVNWKNGRITWKGK